MIFNVNNVRLKNRQIHNRMLDVFRHKFYNHDWFIVYDVPLIPFVVSSVLFRLIVSCKSLNEIQYNFMLIWCFRSAQLTDQIESNTTGRMQLENRIEFWWLNNYKAEYDPNIQWNNKHIFAASCSLPFTSVFLTEKICRTSFLLLSYFQSNNLYRYIQWQNGFHSPASDFRASSHHTVARIWDLST